MQAEVIDRIKGCLFGQAIGDALGYGAEFLTKAQAQSLYPDGLTQYAQITRFPISRHWQPGDWTDDTDQMLCIFDSLLALGKVDSLDIAQRFRTWAETDGYRIGKMTFRVLFDRDFLDRPTDVAEKYWQLSRCQSAPNGAVMRTSILGIWDYFDRDRVIKNASIVCQLTHADPRCVASCIAVCLAISEMISGCDDIPALIDRIGIEIDSYHPEISTYWQMIQSDSIEAFDLDEGHKQGEKNTIGYTLKTVGASFWALRHANSFEEGISLVINEAGDADTNSAVSGSLLGAKFGYQSINRDWIDGLIYKQQLQSRIDRLVTSQS
jgi:ADP-ribosylglycohydrolase